ncbi:hypothetical protein GGQ80_000137 [Sphingomonas jinjuensis]|uniref:Cell envelope biogenesis protein TolA n=1 Tax=Sphingomonas jinjuensis TaxID=535907 RepID=A0A840F6Z9_9SPHN|nr:hypothetical protein [Sphingomonas jinjuensis]MBB4152261.1 hypothetical protein [Sphingomonas jinjuensis]
MARTLKVYRTPIGFHDAYVAAPSQKAALEAWGSDANLFPRGVAEEVTDPSLTKEALDHPGKVIRTLRGTAEEQMAALPADKPKRKAPAAPAKRPQPSRRRLDAAEAALKEATSAFANEKRRLDRQAAELARSQAALAKRTDRELAELAERRDAEDAAYRKALDD